jgi:serine/threonine protein phosphatase PrpC
VRNIIIAEDPEIRPRPDRPGIATGWVAFGASVRGVRHLRRGQPNQDAVTWSRAGDTPDQPVVVAVADGHGSAPHPRSGEGARTAVEIAVALLGDWLRTAPVTDDGAALPQRIVAAWRRSVEQHLTEHPVTGRPVLAEGDIHGLYGTTLLAAGACRGTVFCLQIGDGDILALTADGTLFKPLADSLDCVENLTDSLCQEDAADRFRLARIDGNVELLLLATDGYGNSYENDADFEEIGPDYRALLHRVGVERAAAGLPGWLADVTRTGSGDDITLGLLWMQRR